MRKRAKIKKTKENETTITAEEFLFAKYFDRDFTEHEKQLLNEFLLKLDDNNRFLFESMFGLNGKKKLKHTEIGAALKMSSPSVYRWCQVNIKKLSDYLNGLEFENVKKVKYFRQNHKYELIKEYFRCPPPEDREILDKFFSSLNEQQLSVFELYFGLNGKKPLNQQEIAQKMNTYATKIFRSVQTCLRKFATIYNDRKDATNANENKEGKHISQVIKDVRPLRPRAHKYQARRLVDGTKLLFNNFLKKPYTQENMEIVCQYLDRVDDKKRFVFERYFGLNGKEQLNQKEIAKQTNNAQTNISRIVRYCSEKIVQIIDGKAQLPTKKEKVEKTTREQLLFEKYLERPYNDENKKILLSQINDFKPKNKLVFESYFGLNGREEQTLENISEKLDVSRACIWQIVHNCIEKLKHYKTNEQLLFDNYLHQPLTEENIAKVNTFIASLPKKEHTIFVHYFGLNGAKKLKTTQFSPICSAANACIIIKKLIQQLNAKLEEKEKEN